VKRHGRPAHRDNLVNAGGDPEQLRQLAPLVMPADVNWREWRTCRTCSAAPGEACRTLSSGKGPTGSLLGGLPRERPHSGRTKRTNSGRDGR